MNPGTIDKQGREDLADILVGWFSNSKYTVEAKNRERYSSIDVYYNNVYFANLIIDDCDDLLFNDTQECVNYADPEFFDKLSKILEDLRPYDESESD